MRNSMTIVAYDPHTIPPKSYDKICPGLRDFASDDNHMWCVWWDDHVWLYLHPYTRTIIRKRMRSVSVLMRISWLPVTEYLCINCAPLEIPMDQWMNACLDHSFQAYSTHMNTQWSHHTRVRWRRSYVHSFEYNVTMQANCDHGGIMGIWLSYDICTLELNQALALFESNIQDHTLIVCWLTFTLDFSHVGNRHLITWSFQQ